MELCGSGPVGGTQGTSAARYLSRAGAFLTILPDHKAGRTSLILVAGALTLAAGPALAAEGAKGPSAVIFIAQLAALMLTGRLLGEAMLRIGQPAVMGQLIAGLLLGPSVFGLIAPDWQHFLFPPAKDQKAMLDAIAQFGILVLLLLTGM